MFPFGPAVLDVIALVCNGFVRDDDILFIDVAVRTSLATCLLQEPLVRSEKAYPGTSGRQ